MREDGPTISGAAAGAKIGAVVGQIATGKTEKSKNDTIQIVDENVEENAKKARAKANLQGQINSGNSTYITNIAFDDINIQTGTMTLRDIEKAYNLPQGTLRHDKPEEGYYGGQVPLNGEIYISAGDLADALGISKADLKKMYSEEQIVTLKQNIKNSYEAIKNRIWNR